MSFKWIGARRGLTVFSGLVAATLLAGCAVTQAAQSQPVPAAANLDVLVANTIVRVDNIENRDLIRSEIEDLASGLYWSRGARSTDALIEIDGTAESFELSSQDVEASIFGETDLFGHVSLVDVTTGEVVVGPLFVRVAVGTGRDAGIGLAENSKVSVELEYLVQKFILASREALYGRGV